METAGKQPVKCSWIPHCSVQFLYYYYTLLTLNLPNRALFVQHVGMQNAAAPDSLFSVSPLETPFPFWESGWSIFMWPSHLSFVEPRRPLFKNSLGAHRAVQCLLSRANLELAINIFQRLNCSKLWDYMGDSAALRPDKSHCIFEIIGKELMTWLCIHLELGSFASAKEHSRHAGQFQPQDGHEFGMGRTPLCWLTWGIWWWKHLLALPAVLAKISQQRSQI